MISRSEASYVATSLQPSPDGTPVVRADGRTALAYRPVSLATGVAPQANGSARCSIGGTDVLVGCKLEVAGIEGAHLSCSVECTSAALASLTTDPSPALTDFLMSLLHPLRFAPQLSISSEQSWSLYVDVTILSSEGGNLYDVIGMCARAAIGDTLVPRTRAVAYQAPSTRREQLDRNVGDEDTGMKGLLRGQKGAQANEAKAVDFELLDREVGQGMIWENRESIPVVVTVNLLDHRPFFDATLAEENVAPSRLVLGFSSHGKQLCHITQLGNGEVESLQLSPLIKQAASVASDLQKALDAKWSDAATSAGGALLGVFA